MQRLLEMSLTNAMLASILALAVVVLSKLARRPALSHTLWVLVLLKLVTPPFVGIPIRWPSGLEEPVAGQTTGQPNEAMRKVQGWLQDIYEAGGTADDLRKAWSSWSMVSTYQFRVAKAALIDGYEALVKRAHARERELVDKAAAESAPMRALELARVNVAAYERRVEMLRPEVDRARARLTKFETELGDFRVTTFAREEAHFAQADLDAAIAKLADFQRELEAAQRAVEARA